MTDDDRARVHAARQRAMANAEAFFGSLSEEQLEAQQTLAQECSEGRRPAIDRDEIGAAYDEYGWMAKSDYQEMERIIAACQAGAALSDGELETMIRFLRETKEAIIRARVLAFLGELVKHTAPGPARRMRIERAIEPSREGPNDLDILYWAFVRQALDAH